MTSCEWGAPPWRCGCSECQEVLREQMHRAAKEWEVAPGELEQVWVCDHGEEYPVWLPKLLVGVFERMRLRHRGAHQHHLIWEIHRVWPQIKSGAKVAIIDKEGFPSLKVGIGEGYMSPNEHNEKWKVEKKQREEKARE